MELQILVSKKGTKVVTATELYRALQLPNQHYAVSIKKWINEFYAFRDDIRKPVRMRDYAPRKVKDNPILDDYYLSIELAKLITLHSKSKLKQRYARFLHELDGKTDRMPSLTSEQMLHLLELTRAMSLVSCQEASEREHLRKYKERNEGLAIDWWRYRAEVLGYSAEELRDKLRRKGKRVSGKTQRQMLATIDKYELIRAGIIDLFMSMGKTATYARNMGDVAKTLAKEMSIDVCDDRKGQSLFAPVAKPEVIQQLKGVLLDTAA